LHPAEFRSFVVIENRHRRLRMPRRCPRRRRDLGREVRPTGNTLHLAELFEQAINVAIRPGT
jgi:hypothetical protein